jgi:hypothetical protein
MTCSMSDTTAATNHNSRIAQSSQSQKEHQHDVHKHVAKAQRGSKSKSMQFVSGDAPNFIQVSPMQYCLSALDTPTGWWLCLPFRLGTWFSSLTGCSIHLLVSGRAYNCQDKVQVRVAIGYSLPTHHRQSLAPVIRPTIVPTMQHVRSLHQEPMQLTAAM